MSKLLYFHWASDSKDNDYPKTFGFGYWYEISVPF